MGFSFERPLLFPQPIVHHHHYYGDLAGSSLERVGEARSNASYQTGASSNYQQDSSAVFQPKSHSTAVYQPHHPHDQPETSAAYQPAHSTIYQPAHSFHQGTLSTVSLPQPWSPASRPFSHLPYILSSYLQVLINAAVSLYAAYLFYAVVLSIRQDVLFKVSQQTRQLMVEIDSCRRAYYENNCMPETIVPALERQCAYWHKCMSQDPAKRGNTSSISAQTIGILINSLVEPLGIKFFCVVAGFMVVIFGCNFTFGYIRAKMYYGWKYSEVNGQDAGAGQH
ncbi:uncharacterized protein CANTADRAFT_50134 [Suhomyces tanzawaensis NRRL Y-17324]|uniref:Brl1/Brr6 domain-containing protein n=1 Tax=Suhomyces tanzawaensis NRRL Y-17324 TaxID=984487 RepID=A0A1E4SKB4_9ASCO|nr:uncharacterized protein CANTADRAFT_50134 [Suhomyces tanzawaensis NRRL Y-17324]ODV79949.1 hypothetical protein CANTADRAFT_50134 [Suhomyces tanzawaensis NRRL Y-17324]